jgi:hypothetical protein
MRQHVENATFWRMVPRHASVACLAMTPCPRCHRHLRNDAASCPFCGATRLLKAGALILALAGTGIVTLLTACYGPPPRALQEMVGPDAAPSHAPATVDRNQ